MAFEPLKDNFHHLEDDVKDYIDAQKEYYKLLALKYVAKSVLSIIKITLFALIISMAFLFLSIGVAFDLGEHWGDNALGFLFIGGLYLMVFILLFIFRKKLFRKSILKHFTDVFYHQKD